MMDHSSEWHPAEFIRGIAVFGVDLSYTVPMGTRAIITNVTGWTNSGNDSNSNVFASAAGFDFWSNVVGFAAPNNEPVFIPNLWVPVNEGETILARYVTALPGTVAGSFSCYMGGWLISN